MVKTLVSVGGAWPAGIGCADPARDNFAQKVADVLAMNHVALGRRAASNYVRLQQVKHAVAMDPKPDLVIVMTSIAETLDWMLDGSTGGDISLAKVNYHGYAPYSKDDAFYSGQSYVERLPGYTGEVVGEQIACLPAIINKLKQNNHAGDAAPLAHEPIDKLEFFASFCDSHLFDQDILLDQTRALIVTMHVLLKKHGINHLIILPSDNELNFAVASENIARIPPMEDMPRYFDRAEKNRCNLNEQGHRLLADTLLERLQ